jgi:hypothetical protein
VVAMGNRRRGSGKLGWCDEFGGSVSRPSNRHRLGGSRPRMGNVNRLQMAATTGVLNSHCVCIRSCLPGNP